ncbi:MAG: HupE/UreJ family protein [Deltaproteobacteria bacterium]
MRLATVRRRARALTLALAILVAAGGAAPPDADAHAKSLSYSSWEMTPTGARVQARMSTLDASAIADAREATTPGASAPATGDDRVGAYLARRLQLFSSGSACVPGGPPSAVPAGDGWIAREWHVECPVSGAREIRDGILRPENPAHIHFGRVRLATGRVVERILGGVDATWLVDAPAAGPRADAGAGSSFARYVALGVQHILTGWDHLAFLLALLLLARTFSEVATLVTAFTVAHSVTLALAVLGVLRPQARAVEALIGFSIALAATENSWLLAGRHRAVPWAAAGLLGLVGLAGLRHPAAIGPLALAGLAIFSLCHFALLDRAKQPGRLRAAVAFAFGLAHGFGFAGVLAEMDLPRARLVAALVGFNLGVELGQLAVVSIAWPLLRLHARTAGEETDRILTEALSAAIAGLGLYWFVTRTFR